LLKKAGEAERRRATKQAATSGEALKKKRKARDDVNEKLVKQAQETGWSVGKLVGQLEPRVLQKKATVSKNKKRLEALKAKSKAKAGAKAKGKAKAGAKSLEAPPPLPPPLEPPPPLEAPEEVPEEKFVLPSEAVKRAWLCSEFLRWNTLARSGDDDPGTWAKELTARFPMCLPGEIMDLWVRFHIWNGGKPLQIGYMEFYTLYKLKDVDAAEFMVLLEQLEEKFQHCSQLVLPIWTSDHWVLLQANKSGGTVQFADSLNGPASDKILQVAKTALGIWSRLPSWSWVPTEVPPRWNTVRQGCSECGFFVATWLERVALKAAGKPTLELSADVNVKELKRRLVKFLEAWRPTMGRLQGEVPGKAAIALGDKPSSAAATQAALEQDLSKAAGGFRTGLEPSGSAANTQPLEEYEDEDEWANAVLEFLSPEHQSAATEVLLKTFDGVPCSKCTGGCRHCVFWRAVRYWRNIETGGKVAECYNKRSCSLARLKGNVGSQVHLVE
jgi:hypothetical protein